jgi:hypothetical protein
VDLAKTQGWLGEVEALELNLVHITEKLAQVERAEGRQPTIEQELLDTRPERRPARKRNHPVISLRRSAAGPSLLWLPSPTPPGNPPHRACRKETTTMFDWLPDTEDWLRDMLDQGLLSERHTVDFKEKLDPGKGANREHARDLAQFGPDGGVLIVGVDDDGQLTPIELAGQRERIDQIARTIPDPPMHVRIEEIPAAGQPGKGYLLVIVPPSPDAPHMVDGRYYGRGDTTKHVLSAAEVQSLHQLALRRQRDAEELLDAEVRRDPCPPELHDHAHLFGIAHPVGASADLLQRVLKNPEGWSRFIQSKIRGGPAGQPLGDDLSPGGWSPDLPRLDDISRRARGWALSAPGIQKGRKVVPPEPGTTSPAVVEKRLLDLEIGEDGSLRLFCGRASDAFGTRFIPDEATEAVFESLILGLTKRLVLIAVTVAETADNLGPWDFAIAVVGLSGLVSCRLVQRGDNWAATPFSEPGYRETVRATHERLVKDPDSIVEDLTGRLNRALGGSAPIPKPQ